MPSRRERMVGHLGIYWRSNWRDPGGGSESAARRKARAGDRRREFRATKRGEKQRAMREIDRGE